MNFNTIFTKSLLLLIIFSITISSCAVKKKQGEITTTSTNKEIPKPEFAPPPPPPPTTINEEYAPVVVDQDVEVEWKMSPVPEEEKNYTTEEEIFRVVEEMPRFLGCEDIEGSNKDKKDCANKKLYEFVGRSIHYPAEARQNSIQGRCFVTFVIEKDGTISDAQLIRDIGGGCGEESLRVVNEMTKQGVIWIPGKQRGRPVRVQVNLPIKFSL